MRIFLYIILHDLKLGLRNIYSSIYISAFFVLAAILFPFGIGVENNVLQSLAGGVIWSAALLSFMLAIPKIYSDDYDNGSLTQLMLLESMPELLVLARIISTWIIYAIPLLIVSPLLAVMFYAEANIVRIFITLAIGTMTMAALGNVAAAITLGIRRSVGLVALVILPFFIPILIFGSNGIAAAADEYYFDIAMLFLLLVIMLPISIFATVGAINLAIEYE